MGRKQNSYVPRIQHIPSLMPWDPRVASSFAWIMSYPGCSNPTNLIRDAKSRMLPPTSEELNLQQNIKQAGHAFKPKPLSWSLCLAKSLVLLEAKTKIKVKDPSFSSLVVSFHFLLPRVGFRLKHQQQATIINLFYFQILDVLGGSGTGSIVLVWWHGMAIGQNGKFDDQVCLKVCHYHYHLPQKGYTTLEIHKKLYT